MPTPRIPCPAFVAAHAGMVARAIPTTPAEAERALDAIRVAVGADLPKRSIGSKTGPALESEALRSNRLRAALVVFASLAGATPVCAQGWIEQPNFIISDDHTLLRSDPTYRAACIVTLGIRDGKPTIRSTASLAPPWSSSARPDASPRGCAPALPRSA